MTNCVTCDGKARTGVRMCRGCEHKLEAWLNDVPDLCEQLEVTITRQDKFQVGRDGGRSTTKPLPFNERASAIKHDLTHCLNFWAREIGLTASDLQFHPLPKSTDPKPVSEWLSSHKHLIVTHLSAGSCFRDIETAVRRSRQIIDRPPDKVFAGPCNTEVRGFGGSAFCTEDLYAQPGKPTAVCKMCHTEHDVQKRREWMLEQINGQAADAGLLASILNQLDFQISSSTIRRYGAEGLLTVVSRDAKGVPRYNVGEVIRVFFDKKERQKAGKKKKVSNMP